MKDLDQAFQRIDHEIDSEIERIEKTKNWESLRLALSHWKIILGIACFIAIGLPLIILLLYNAL